MNASYPWDDELKGWSQCLRRDPILDGNSQGHDNWPVQTPIGSRELADTEGIKPCEEYVYDRRKYKSTTTSEVCLLSIKRKARLTCLISFSSESVNANRFSFFSGTWSAIERG